MPLTPGEAGGGFEKQGRPGRGRRRDGHDRTALIDEQIFLGAAAIDDDMIERDRFELYAGADLVADGIAGLDAVRAGDDRRSGAGRFIGPRAEQGELERGDDRRLAIAAAQPEKRIEALQHGRGRTVEPRLDRLPGAKRPDRRRQHPEQPRALHREPRQQQQLERRIDVGARQPPQQRPCPRIQYQTHSQKIPDRRGARDRQLQSYVEAVKLARRFGPNCFAKPAGGLANRPGLWQKPRR